MDIFSTQPARAPSTQLRRRTITALTIVFLTQFLSVGCVQSKSNSTPQQLNPQSNESKKEMAHLIDMALKQLDESMNELEVTEQSPKELNFAQAPKLNAKTQRQVRELLSRVNNMWTSIGRNPCSIWTPIERKFGKTAIQPYFFMGGSAEGGAGLHGIIGADYVWDLYNLQLGVFSYKSFETVFGSGSVGVGLNSYLGLGFGQKKKKCRRRLVRKVCQRRSFRLSSYSFELSLRSHHPLHRPNSSWSNRLQHAGRVYRPECSRESSFSISRGPPSFCWKLDC